MLSRALIKLLDEKHKQYFYNTNQYQKRLTHTNGQTITHPNNQTYRLTGQCLSKTCHRELEMLGLMSSECVSDFTGIPQSPVEITE